ncbi:hypothetical protein HJ01_03176 [Flavobacterium frigoris PS1]|uniref:Uncharacterized protein n=1 Tax=Flavobacterium frigoris (strain PS1) TaxID=1086011 RepID=H7FVH8_FLAFP|nr:hypothetical protein HJ01_03176 [Flavobacterium frigoris PS1]
MAIMYGNQNPLDQNPTILNQNFFSHFSVMPFHFSLFSKQHSKQKI